MMKLLIKVVSNLMRWQMVILPTQEGSVVTVVPLNYSLLVVGMLRRHKIKCNS